MSTREIILLSALGILEREGAEQFSTRAVCALANVTAPTLYHHFGSADGLLSETLAEAFRQFIERKETAAQSSDPEMALKEGWDDYVRFAAERPRLYAAMLGRVLSGADIPAAKQGFALLRQRVAAIAAADRLTITLENAVQLAWASANAAALLYVPVALDGMTKPEVPNNPVVESLRDHALRAICDSQPQGEDH